MTQNDTITNDDQVAALSRTRASAKLAYETFCHRAGPSLMTPWEHLPQITVDAWIEVVKLIRQGLA